MSHVIGVGDLLRAWHALDANDEAARRAISDLLLPGFGWSAMATKPVVPREPPQASPQPHSVIQQVEVPDVPSAAEHQALDIPFSVTPVVSSGEPQRTLARGPRLAADRNLTVATAELLEPEWARRIVGELMMTEAPLGDLDLPRIIHSLSEMREIRRIPRKSRPTLRLGAQVLLDRHPSMMVFYSDQSALRPVLAGIGGRGRTLLLRCDGFPPTSISEISSARWRPYEPPPPGTPVLILSDLGMARGAYPLSAEAEAAWDAFLAPLAATGNPLIALVPHPPTRYPLFICERICLVLWDRVTRPSDVRRARKAIM